MRKPGHQRPIDEEFLRRVYEQAPPSRRWLVAASSPFDGLPVQALKPGPRVPASFESPEQFRVAAM